MRKDSEGKMDRNLTDKYAVKNSFWAGYFVSKRGMIDRILSKRFSLITNCFFPFAVFYSLSPIFYSLSRFLLSLSLIVFSLSLIIFL